MSPQGFHAFVKNARRPDAPFGDFIADARDDTRLPDHFEDADRLRSYLKLSGACAECVDLAPEVFRLYVQSPYFPAASGATPT